MLVRAADGILGTHRSTVTDSRATSPIRRRSTFTRMPILIRAVRAATAAITATGSATSQR